MSDGEPAGSSIRTDNQVVLEYIKSQFFRVVHVDGAIGGPTPSGQIHLALFSERPAIPRRLVARIDGGMLGEAIPEQTVVRDGMIRELDIDLMMSLSAADEVAKLLTRMVADVKATISKNQDREKA